MFILMSVENYSVDDKLATQMILRGRDNAVLHGTKPLPIFYIGPP